MSAQTAKRTVYFDFSATSISMGVLGKIMEKVIGEP
jgi:hypothetical protein